jgi:radical SAM/Cys-rich protein
MTGFREQVSAALGGPLRALGIDVLQVNLGYQCNMSCRHCHVEAGPGRKEIMDGRTADDVLRVLQRNDIGVLDLTGGAPEMNPHFRTLVEKASEMGRHVIVRTNLTIFFEQGMEYLPGFFRDCGVEVTASLPYYLAADVDRVRGQGTFTKCVEAVKQLNGLGYGSGSGDLILNFIYNPPGAFPAPAQKTMEEDFRLELGRRHGIKFDSLYVLANMPIGRFRTFLIRSGNLERYTERLACAFNQGTLDGLMCRHMVSIGWNGRIYDCDFNQVLGLGVRSDCPQQIRDFDHARLFFREVTVGDHCYACTAGQGST